MSSKTKATISDIFAKMIADKIYPIGSIYMSINNVDPSLLFGGTWVRWSKGRVPIGVYEEDTDFNIADKIGGSKTHTLLKTELPKEAYISGSEEGAINFLINPGGNTYGISVLSPNLGQPFKLIQSYTTCYMWKRVA